MKLAELVLKNRSYRKFDESRKIPHETLVSLVDMARLTPSSVNIQPFKYYISDSDETNAKIRPHTYWARLLKEYNGPAGGENPAAYIIVCTDKKIAPNIERFSVDLGIVSQTILLGAVEAGFGGCMIKNFDIPEVAEELGLAENLHPSMVIALGVPDEKIILEEHVPGTKTSYYRDENNLHHVPKRKLSDIIV